MLAAVCNPNPDLSGLEPHRPYGTDTGYRHDITVPLDHGIMGLPYHNANPSLVSTHTSEMETLRGFLSALFRTPLSSFQPFSGIIMRNRFDGVRTNIETDTRQAFIPDLEYWRPILGDD